LPCESVLAMPDRPASKLEPMARRCWLRAVCSRAAATAPHGTRSSCFPSCAEVVSAAVGSRVTSPARYCMQRRSQRRRLRTWQAHLPSESVLAMPDRPASKLEPMARRCWLRAVCSRAAATAPHGTRSSCFPSCAEVVSAAVGSRVTSPARYCMQRRSQRRRLHTWQAHLPSESVLAMPDRPASKLEPMARRCWLRTVCSRAAATAPHGTRSSCFPSCAKVVSAAVGSRVTSPARYCMQRRSQRRRLRTWLAHLPSESVLAMPDRPASKLEPMARRCWLRTVCSRAAARCPTDLHRN